MREKQEYESLVELQGQGKKLIKNNWWHHDLDVVTLIKGSVLVPKEQPASY